ncbi:MAG: TolC family protein [Deltaproteobacteria bacterium]
MLFAAWLVAGLMAQDTLRLDAQAALDRAARAAYAVRAATERRGAAEAMLRQAGAWPNPLLQVVAENIGAEREVTGRSGLAGIEGQVTLTSFLPVGGGRGAAIERARAELRVAKAGSEVAAAAARADAVAAIAAADRDATLARNAAVEALDLQRFADALAHRADEGRSAGGEAARATLEAAMAATRAGRRQAEAARSAAVLTRVLGVEAGTAVVVLAPACAPVASAESGAPPDLAAAAARVDVAAAAERLARAQLFPVIEPQVGLRRTAGFSGLLLGVAFPLPLANQYGNAARAARLERAAAEADRQDLEAALAAEQRGLAAGVAAFDSAGLRFTGDWSRALDRTLTSAVARYDAGEGSLTELLDARRARLAALDDLAQWRAERRLLRARLARAAGAPIDAQTLCDATPEIVR